MARCAAFGDALAFVDVDEYLAGPHPLTGKEQRLGVRHLAVASLPAAHLSGGQELNGGAPRLEAQSHSIQGSPGAVDREAHSITGRVANRVWESPPTNVAGMLSDGVASRSNPL